MNEAANSVYATLVPLSPNSDLQTIHINKNEFTIGRDKCQVDGAINATFVSRLHFCVELSGENTFLKNLSEHGTYVNEIKVSKGQRHPLPQDAVIGFSRKDTSYKFIRKEYGHCEDHLRFPAEIRENYVIDILLGQGGNAKVYKAYALQSQNFEAVAIKTIRKRFAGSNENDGYSFDYDRVMDEADIWKELDHPCVIKFHQAISCADATYFVIEHAEGGELFDFVLEDFKNDTSSERVAKVQFFQMLSGLAHLHGQGYAHRDLKLENILLKTRSKVGLIKIADFGLSRLATNSMCSFVGTPQYTAPEVLLNGITESSKKPYTQKADMWSAGCILYSLLSGSQAFNSDSERGSLKASILHGTFLPMVGQRWQNVSDLAITLLRRLLQVNPKLRPTAEQALADPWFTSDPYLVNEATMVMEGMKEQATIDECSQNPSPQIDSPLRKMGLSLKPICNPGDEVAPKQGIDMGVKGEKRKSPSEEKSPIFSLKAKLKKL